MKKQIPEKRINKIKVVEKQHSYSRFPIVNNWIQETAYKPGTNEISNRFFKSSVGVLSLVDRRYKPQVTLKRYKSLKLLNESTDNSDDYI